MSDQRGPISGGAGDALIAHLVAQGYERAEPAVLQPAPVFLDLAGEDIRGRLYITSDSSGAEFCLRPEYTIPVCRDYLAGPRAARPDNRGRREWCIPAAGRIRRPRRPR